MKSSRKSTLDKRRTEKEKAKRLQSEIENVWGRPDTWRCFYRDRPSALALAGPCEGVVNIHGISIQSDDLPVTNKNSTPLCARHSGWEERSA